MNLNKFFVFSAAFFIAIFMSACGETGTGKNPAENGKNAEEEMTKMQIKIQIDDKFYTADLEDNEAAREFAQMLPISVEMRDYGGFEKVGSLGKSLTSSDSQTTTVVGDIVLYNSDQIVIFYGSNSWSYTRLGHIDNFSDIGSGNITAVFSIE